MSRFTIVAAVCGVTLFALTGTAAAHVSVTPAEIGKTGSSQVTFRVPNESATAGTIKVELTLPAEYPITSVRAEPKQGWALQVTRAKLEPPVKIGTREVSEAVRTVTWTAEAGARIGPDQYADFGLYVSGLPDNTDKLVIAAAQTYEDGKVANWANPPTSDGKEPQDPAPVLKLAAAGAGQPTTAASSQTTAAAGQDDSARLLGGSALVVAALALGIGVGALLRGRRTGKETQS
ncbi:YcnI family protein [Lentzea sp. BCCO 10_0798]|uniref:YcnI family protein n=1 Tax=Lentzea kristufekii TaxID=3095430 RepID=A0ABU4TJN6_9PSEU|nr:YcnI family protein [Lentzea sp. BCCO 10_0798]MDX8048467.1 YcnI family protein [Lentzea sp. BCCO 10_0798]